MNLIGKVVEKEKLIGELSQGVEYYKGERGPKGDAFTYEDFTQEQLNALKGPQGEPGQKGDKGDAFTYADFTQEQLEALRGPQGIQGVPGETGPAGQPGQNGKDGVSITHTWNGTSLSITSASGTSEMDLRGPAGQDYVLTQDDKTEIAGLVDLTNYATTTYVDNAVSNIEIPEEIKHITITDATELLNLETGLYIVDNEFTVNTLKGEITFSGALSVKQDWRNYIFINYGTFLCYNDGDETWDFYQFVLSEDIVALQEQINNRVTQEEVDTAIANSGFQTEEQVTIKVGNILSGLGYQNRQQVQQIVTQMDIDASKVKNIKGNPANGYVLEGNEYTLQQMANVFDNEFKRIGNAGYQTKQKVDTAISNALANSGFQTEEQVLALINQQLGVIENGTY